MYKQTTVRQGLAGGMHLFYIILSDNILLLIVLHIIVMIELVISQNYSFEYANVFIRIKGFHQIIVLFI